MFCYPTVDGRTVEDVEALCPGTLEVPAGEPEPETVVGTAVEPVPGRGATPTDDVDADGAAVVTIEPLDPLEPPFAAADVDGTSVVRLGVNKEVEVALIVGAGTSTVTVTMTVIGGPPGTVDPGTCTMMTCGGAVAGSDVGPGTVVGSVSVEDVEVDVVVSAVRPDRLISDAMIDPATEATPMIAAAIIGPHLVRLMRPALDTVSAPMIASDGTAGAEDLAMGDGAGGGGGVWLSSPLTLSA